MIRRSVLCCALALAAVGSARAQDAAKPESVVVVHVAATEDGRPVANAKVALRARDVELATARTNAAGDAELHAAWAADAFVEASAAGRGFDVKRLTCSVLPSGQSWFGDRAHAARVELTLGPGAPLRGFVVDDTDGKPVAGARVVAVPVAAAGVGGQGRTELTFVQTFADASGAFLFEGLSPGDVELFVLARGFAVVGRWIGGVRAPQTFHLERAGTIRLRVLHGDDRPFARASVEWDGQLTWSPDGDGWWTGLDDRLLPTTDADGVVEFPHATLGLRFAPSLRVGTSLYALRETEASDLVRVTADRRTREFVVKPENEDAPASASLYVAVEREGPMSAPSQVVASLSPLDSAWPIANAEGLPLRFDRVAPGRYRLDIWAKNAPDWTGEVEIDAKARPTRTTVRLGGKETIEGRVVDERGEPVAGVAVAWGPSGWSAEPRWGDGGVSDERGAFRVSGLARGRYWLCIEPHGYGTESVVRVDAPAKDVRLVAPRMGAVTLRVAVPDRCARPDDFWCRDGLSKWVDDAVTLTLPAGRRRVELEPRFQGHGSGCLPVVLDVDVKAGETLDVGARTLDAGLRVAGVVLAPDGRPTSAALGDGRVAYADCGEDGRFSVGPLPRGPATLVVHDGMDVGETTFDAATPPKDLVVRLVRARMIRVETGRRAGSQAPWFRVDAVPRGATKDAWPLPLPQLDRASWHGTLDARGVACLPLPPGEWTLRVVGEGSAVLATTEVVVPAAGDGALRVALPVK